MLLVSSTIKIKVLLQNTGFTAKISKCSSLKCKLQDIVIYY